MIGAFFKAKGYITQRGVFLIVFQACIDQFNHVIFKNFAVPILVQELLSCPQIPYSLDIFKKKADSFYEFNLSRMPEPVPSSKR